MSELGIPRRLHYDANEAIQEAVHFVSLDGPLSRHYRLSMAPEDDDMPIMPYRLWAMGSASFCTDCTTMTLSRTCPLVLQRTLADPFSGYLLLWTRELAASR